MWIIRNYFIYGEFVTRSASSEVSTGMGVWWNVWYGYNPYIGIDFEKECWYLSTKIVEELSKVPLSERDNYAKKKVMSLIFDDPLRTIKISIIKFGRFWKFYPHKTKYLSEVFQKSTDWIKIISLLSDGWIIPFALIGFLLSLPLWRQHLLISLWVWSQALGITIIYYPMIRYRFPVMPIVMLFAGYGLYFVWRSFLLKKEI